MLEVSQSAQFLMEKDVTKLHKPQKVSIEHIQEFILTYVDSATQI